MREDEAESPSSLIPSGSDRIAVEIVEPNPRPLTAESFERRYAFFGRMTTGEEGATHASNFLHRVGVRLPMIGNPLDSRAGDAGDVLGARVGRCDVEGLGERDLHAKVHVAHDAPEFRPL